MAEPKDGGKGKGRRSKGRPSAPGTPESKPAEGSPRPRRKTPISFEVPADAVEAPASGWVNRSKPAGPPVPSAAPPTRSTPTPATPTPSAPSAAGSKPALPAAATPTRAALAEVLSTITPASRSSGPAAPPAPRPAPADPHPPRSGPGLLASCFAVIALPFQLVLLAVLSPYPLIKQASGETRRGR